MLTILIFPKMLFANPTEKGIKSWYIPEYSKVQFAGNIGFMSVGLGYEWWNKKAQTDVMYGYVSENKGNASIHTFTLKNSFRLYHFNIIDRYNLSPIMGFSLSFEPGQNGYMRVPDRYPDGYYSPNSFYACLNLGMKSKFKFNEKSHFSALELYTEINSLANYIYYNIAAKEDKSLNVLSMAIGINVFF